MNAVAIYSRIPLRPALLSALFIGALNTHLTAQEPPPAGAFVPGEVKLAGFSRVAADQPVRVDVWAIRPEMPYHYSGVKNETVPSAELTLEMHDAKGGLAGNGTPRFRHGKWQEITLAPEGLKPGSYEAVLTLLYDGLPFSRATKRITVLTEADLTATPGVSSAELAKIGSLETKPFAGDRTVAVLPAKNKVVVPLSGEGEMAVYGTVSGPVPAFQASVGERQVVVPGSSDQIFTQEIFLGFGKGGADSLVLQAGKEDLLLVGLRLDPLNDAKASLAAHSKPNVPTQRDKEVVINNDGFSEGFFDPQWNFLELPLQVQRYKGTEATQLDWCALVSDVVSYQSKFADFYGEKHSGEWATAGNKGARQHFLALEQHDPKMFSWLVETGREIGLPVWGSLRMSVSYGSHPFGKDFNGQMWHERPELRLKKEPDEPADNDNPLSFAYAEVQDRRIGVLGEMAEMGCEGVNLDYCRYPLIMGYDKPLLERFKAVHREDGSAYALDDPKWVKIRQHAHNNFLRQVRRALDKVGKAQGRRVPISIRLPATKYETFGFDPQTWIKEKLVDALIPGFPGMDRWFDAVPWIAMVRGSGVKVWINKEYYRHETAQTELTDEEAARGVKPGYQFQNRHEDYLRRAAEVYAQGADGMYIFNRWTDPDIFRGLADSTYLRHWEQFQNPDHLDSEAQGETKGK